MANSIEFNYCGEYYLPDGSVGKNVNIFVIDMSSSVHIADKAKDILILGKGTTLGLDGTTFTAEALYPIKFTQSGKRFVLSLHYNGSSNFLFVNATKVNQKTQSKRLRKKGLCVVFRQFFKRFYKE